MWKSIFKAVPVDGQVVWVRVQWFYGVPVIATYDATSQSFTANDNGLVFPAYVIGRWKDYTAPTLLPIGEGVIGSTFVLG